MLNFFFLRTESQPVIYLADAPLKLKNQYSSALQFYQIQDFERSIQSFQKIISKYPRFIDAHLILGSVYFDLKKFDLAESYYQKAIALDSHYQEKVFYTIGLCQYQNMKFEMAKQNINYFLKFSNQPKELISKATMLLPSIYFSDSSFKQALPIQFIALSKLNSSKSEYLPTLSGDAKTMVFVRRINPHNEDLYISTQDISGQWSLAEPLEMLNTNFNEGAPSLSSDGKTLIFVSCDRPDSYGGCDLYISRLTNNGWTRPFNLGDRINSPAYDSQPCLAENGRELYFVSNRKGSLGQYDIWFSRFEDSGAWSKPINLGPSINTSSNEETPFMHPNGERLYFSSDGHTGMGASDIFYSDRTGSKKWSTPINLGYPINSIHDDASFIVDFAGKEAYFASDRNPVNLTESIGQIDIYKFSLPESLAPQSADYISLQIVDKSTGKGLSASVKVSNLNLDQNHDLNSESDQNGKLFFSLKGKNQYAIFINKNQYLPHTEHINTNDKPGSYQNPREIKIELNKLGSDSPPVCLKNIFFEFNSSELKQTSEFELIKLFEFLNENKTIKIKIIGHTDSIGDDHFNLQLSESRARTVVQFLIQKGINSSRLEYVGMGEKKPLAANDTEIGRQLNRRTEFQIIP